MKFPMEDKQKAYFQDKQRKFNLYFGDIFKVIKRVKSESIDMIFADPPYNLSNGGFSVHSGRRVSVNKGDWDKSRGIEKDFEF